MVTRRAHGQHAERSLSRGHGTLPVPTHEGTRRYRDDRYCVRHGRTHTVHASCSHTRTAAREAARVQPTRHTASHHTAQTAHAHSADALTCADGAAGPHLAHTRRADPSRIRPPGATRGLTGRPSSIRPPVAHQSRSRPLVPLVNEHSHRGRSDRRTGRKVCIESEKEDHCLMGQRAF